MEADRAYDAIWRILKELVKNNLQAAKAFPTSKESTKYSFVLLEYNFDWIGFTKGQIELSFKEKDTQTFVSLKWRYPDYASSRNPTNGLSSIIFEKKASQVERQTILFLEELKSRLAVTEITSDEEPTIKEIIKEKQVIVKIRCQYCKNLYEETFDKCPHCGAHN